jgi:hypothetical protein
MGRRVIQESDAEVAADAARSAQKREPLRVTSITVTWGEEYIQPLQFNGFKFGGISMTLEVPPGVQPEHVHVEAWNRLNKMAEFEFTTKLAGYIERLKEAHEHVAASRR